MFKKTISAATIAVIAALPAQASQSGLSGAGTAQVTAETQTIEMAQVQSYLDVIAQLEASGYTVDSVEKTFLGRMKITARNRVHLREMVVSRTTGEVMRDAIIEVFADATGDGTGEAATTGEQGENGLSLETATKLNLGFGAGSDSDEDEEDDGNGGGRGGVSVNVGGALSVGN